jgi:pSer/pThr/pTyr-binding forkhead associated (FHA) protein
MKITLKFMTENRTFEHQLELNQSIVCGRSSKAEVKIDDQRVSNKHCRFTLKYDRLEITDLESKNGTFLNGIRIDQSVLFIGDEVRIGKFSIRLHEQDADSEAQEILTFPGPFQDAISNDLKVDFTGARLKNQQLSLENENQMRKMDASQMMEIAVRKKIKSRIRLSKEQIRSKYKGLATAAICFDISFFFLLVALPVFLVFLTVPDELEQNTMLYALLGIETMTIGAYYLTNFKLEKFTLGEKIMGIQKLYMEQ